jgi:hypothetical protein
VTVRATMSMEMTLAGACLMAAMIWSCDKADPCQELVRAVCSAEEPRSEHCERVENWLVETMRASEGERRQLTPDQREIACKAIFENPEVLERYRDEARRAVPPGQAPSP